MVKKICRINAVLLYLWWHENSEVQVLTRFVCDILLDLRGSKMLDTYVLSVAAYLILYAEVVFVWMALLVRMWG